MEDDPKNGGAAAKTLSEQEADERLRRALDAIGDGAWDWNVETGATYYSDQWLDSLGYSREDVRELTDGWVAHVHPDDLDFMNGALEDNLKGLTPQFDSEFRIRLKDGSYRWTHSRARVVERDAAGNPLRVVGMNSDISLAKSVQLALDEAEGRCRSIVETAGCIIAVLDTQYRVREWNPAAERATGWSADEVRGRNFAEWFLPRRFKGPVQEELDRMFAGGDDSFDLEYSMIARDGEERDVLWNASKLLNSEGQVWAIVAIGQDITLRNKALRARDIARQEREVALDLRGKDPSKA